MITFKKAQTQEDINTVGRLRYTVYVEEDKKFGGRNIPDKNLCDHFDYAPNTFNLLMYDGELEVGTVRVTWAITENEILPSDHLFDFSTIRVAHTKQLPLSIGMLAVRKEYQNRKTFMSIMRALGEIIMNIGYPYCIFTLNHECVSLISRLIGAKIIAEKIWSNEVQNFIIPMLIYKEQIVSCYRKNVEHSFTVSTQELVTNNYAKTTIQ